MSTPSTATATTIHPHHTHYAHSHYNPYQTTAGQTPNEAGSSGSARFGQQYSPYQSLAQASNRHTASSSRQPAASISKPSPKSTSTMSRSKTKRQPDWNAFYRNGVPQEIIVIDDSPDPQNASSAKIVNEASQAQGGSTAQPANKKRRTEQGQNATATAHENLTPQYVDSGSNTHSLDRTTSIHTTAPTSLGSHGSMGASSYNDKQMTGQKRKRVTRQATGSDKKRKEAAADALSAYVPPRKPPYKAKEVKVRPIMEVSSISTEPGPMLSLAALFTTPATR